MRILFVGVRIGGAEVEGGIEITGDVDGDIVEVIVTDVGSVLGCVIGGGVSRQSTLTAETRVALFDISSGRMRKLCCEAYSLTEGVTLLESLGTMVSDISVDFRVARLTALG
jgi:hypothetical protein